MMNYRKISILLALLSVLVILSFSSGYKIVRAQDTQAPQYSLNSTNSTVAGTLISHNLFWQDDVNVSGYIFQFCNGTWDGSHCLGTICYQEFANVSTDCGGLGTGSYSGSGAWNDGNWSTYVNTDGHYYINYTKPTHARASSLWQVKDGEGTFNLSIPQSCWDYDPTKLMFEIFIQTPGPSLDENTLILMPANISKKIKDIRIGDFVMSYNEKLKILEPKKVVSIYSHNVSEIYEIEFENEKGKRNYINATANHLFYTNRGLTNVSDLGIGDKLLSISGNFYSITSIRKINEDKRVYDIKVDDNHNYFANGVLVHNQLGGSQWNCYDGTWVTLRSSSDVRVYEEAMWWNISGWLNDTWQPFTSSMCPSPFTECWSNVTKIVNSTEGAKIAWCIYANDTSDNWNSTSCENPFSYVTTGCSIAIGLSDILASGIFWNVNSLPATNLPAEGNSEITQYNVSISITGSCTVDLYIRANDDLTSNGYKIGIGNETYCYNTTDATVPGIDCYQLDTDYQGNQIGSNLEDGSYVYLKFYLDVPAAQPPGNYNNTIFIKGVKSGEQP